MKRIIIISLIFIIPFVLLSNETQNKDSSEIYKQKEDFNQFKKDINKKIEEQSNIINTTFNSLSMQLSASDRYLTWIGICLGLFGIVVVVIVTFTERKVSKMLKESKDLFEKQKEIGDEIEKLDKIIKANYFGIYNKIKEEETKYLVNRIESEPEDINNLAESILTREIPKKYFEVFKKSYQYINIINQDFVEGPYRELYLSVFFQHFADLALFDKDISEEFQKHFQINIGAAFKKDVIKTIGEIVRACINNGFDENKDKIIKFLKALGNITKYHDVKEIYETIYNKLMNKELKFKLAESIIKIPKINFEIVIKNYGELLLNEYKDAHNEKSQKIILEEFEKAINKKQ